MKTRSTHRPTRLALAVLLLAAALAPARAQNFTLEGAVIDSRSAASLGVISERGDVAQLFKAQKTMTFGILRAAGIALDQLPAEVRQRLERFQTTNLDAFRAFSTGLDLKDQGRYAEAKDFFRRAADLDPGFGLAADQQRAMPDVTVSGQAQARAVVIAAAGQAVDRGRQTKIVYQLFYDQAPLGTTQAKIENRAMRTKRFNEALDNMKAMAEAQ